MSKVVNMVGGSSGGGNSYLLNIDFSQAVESFSANNVLVSNSGAYFSTNAAYIWLPFSASGRTIEIDISTSEMTSNDIRSLISQWATGSSHLGLAWHSATGKWGFYINSWQDTDISDINYFANSTLKVYIDSNNKWHFYKDGVLFFEPNAAVAPNGVWSVGANNISCIGLTITGIRVY